MKKLFLYVLFSAAIAIPAFSQVISSQKYDFKLTLPSFENIKELEILKDTVYLSGSFDNSIQFRKFHNPADFQDSLGKGNHLLFQHDENVIVTNSKPIYSLRIMKPNGNYPIQIYKPDSTKNYTLLIKEF